MENPIKKNFQTWHLKKKQSPHECNQLKDSEIVEARGRHRILVIIVVMIIVIMTKTKKKKNTNPTVV